MDRQLGITARVMPKVRKAHKEKMPADQVAKVLGCPQAAVESMYKAWDNPTKLKGVEQRRKVAKKKTARAKPKPSSLAADEFE